MFSSLSFYKCSDQPGPPGCQTNKLRKGQNNFPIYFLFLLEMNIFVIVFLFLQISTCFMGTDKALMWGRGAVYT